MAKARSKQTPRTYTLEEKIALVTKIDQLYRAGGISLKAAAIAAGTTDTSYNNWLAAGIRPSVPAAPSKQAAPPAARRYSEDDRARLVAAVDVRRAQGESIDAACRAEGVSKKSYRRWVADAQPAPAMRPVEVMAMVPAAAAPLPISFASPTPGPALLTLVSPGGYRLEGLGIENAAALLRTLP